MYVPFLISFRDTYKSIFQSLHVVNFYAFKLFLYDVIRYNEILRFTLNNMQINRIKS